jgi:hypothetical protein
MPKSKPTIIDTALSQLPDNPNDFAQATNPNTTNSSGTPCTAASV